MPLFQQSTIETDFTRTHKLIYGYPGTGKTTLASVMIDAAGRKPAFGATEDRHSSLQVARARIKSWEGFVKFVDWVEGNKVQMAAEHSSIVLDVVSDLDAWSATHVAHTKNVEYVGDLDMGKGWKLHRETFQKQMDRLMALMPIVFICHAQEKRVVWNGEQVVTQAPNLSKGAMEYINSKVDTIMFITPPTTKKEFPQVSMRPNLAYIAKAAQKALCREFEFSPENPGATYKEICAIYTGAQKEVLTTFNPFPKELPNHAPIA